MKINSVNKILDLWPSRSEILNDIQIVSPDLSMIAIHRWYARSAIPSKYWSALLHGAALRGLPLTADILVSVHAQPEPNSQLAREQTENPPRDREGTA